MPRVTRPPKILEVIVTSCEEAVAAEAGGANRLELLRSLEDGGLTPPLNLVRQVVEAVSVPVRVMLRANPSMTVANRSEMRLLESQAEALGHLPIDGMVLGFVDGGSIDLASTGALLARAPRVPVTFHRAFEYCADPLAAIEILKKLPQIDRILATGGAGEWPERRRHLLTWQEAAAPIRILVAAGLPPALVSEILEGPDFDEVHVGRAARIPHENAGTLSSQQVALLRNAAPRQ
jgi:copper homeostasis protein